MEIKILKNDIFSFFKTKTKVQYFPMRSVYSNSYFKKRLNNFSEKDEKKSYLWGKVTLDEIPKYTQKNISSYMSIDSIQLCFNLKSITFEKYPSNIDTKFIFLLVEIVINKIK